MRTSEVSHGPKILLFEFSFAFAHLQFDPASFKLMLTGTVSYMRGGQSFDAINPSMSENEGEHAGELELQIPHHKICSHWFNRRSIRFTIGS